MKRLDRRPADVCVYFGMVILMKLVFSPRAFLLPVFLGVFAWNSWGQVAVEVSPTYSSVSYSKSLRLVGDQSETFELPKPPGTDEHKLFYKTKNGSVRVVVFDRINVRLKTPDPIFLLDKLLSGNSMVDIPTGPSKEGVVVSLWNDSSSNVSLDYIVFRIGRRPQHIVLQIKNLVEVPIKAFGRFYRLPKFKVVVVPCGEVNAFSSPDITICSELIADLYEKDLTGALYPIIYHEMAHSLLNLWKLPGFDNEDIADEFAAAMLGRVSPSYIRDFISYLESNDSTTEAVIQLTAGSRHTLSVQRARNMRAALQNISEIENRWGNLLRSYELRKRKKVSK